MNFNSLIEISPFGGTARYFARAKKKMKIGNFQKRLLPQEYSITVFTRKRRFRKQMNVFPYLMEPLEVRCMEKTTKIFKINMKLQIEGNKHEHPVGL